MAIIEVGLNTFQQEAFTEENNDALMRLRLDLIVEYCNKAQLRIALYQQRAKKYFDSRVRSREF